MQITHTQPKRQPHQATLCAVLSLALFGAFAGNGEAAVYSFSFSNVSGPVSGTVSGLITLPDGDGTFPATSFTVTSGPAALGYTYPFDAMVTMPSSILNSFTVVGGNIDPILSTFGRQGASNAVTLNFLTIGTLLTPIGGPTALSGVVDLTDSTLNYSNASTVPESGSYLGLLVGLFSSGIVMRHRRRGVRHA